MSAAIENLRRLGYELPVPAAPRASYTPVTRVGNLMFVSGQVSEDETGIVQGTLGAGMDIAAGQKAAARAALGVLAQIVHSGGVALEDVAQVVKLTVLVASTPDFDQHHVVANGGSELIVGALGDPGRHARAAFGVAALPLGAAVEIEAVVEIRA